MGQQYPGYVTGIPAQVISKVKMLKDCEQDSNSDDVIETSKFYMTNVFLPILWDFPECFFIWTMS